MTESIARRLVALGALVVLALALPGGVAAVVDGGCQITGTSSSGGSIDLTTATEWHILSTDIAGGSGTAPSDQKNGHVAAYALGIGIPIASGTGDGATDGSVEGVVVSTYSILGARFTVAGSSSGDSGGCSGKVTVILDDVNPLLTIFGGGGILAAIIGLLILIWAARSPATGAGRLIAALFGALGFGGAGLALEQFGMLDPTQPFGLGLVVLGLVLGLVFAGRFAAPTPAV